jgi:hypothetical protein
MATHVDSPRTLGSAGMPPAAGLMYEGLSEGRAEELRSPSYGAYFNRQSGRCQGTGGRLGDEGADGANVDEYVD